MKPLMISCLVAGAITSLAAVQTANAKGCLEGQH
jgi:hypothetical protein